MWIARKYNASHKERGASTLAHLMAVYLPEEGHEQMHEALSDVKDLLGVLKAMADKKEIRFSDLLAMGRKKKLRGFRSRTHDS